jgi:hypothetical protein
MSKYGDGSIAARRDTYTSPAEMRRHLMLEASSVWFGGDLWRGRRRDQERDQRADELEERGLE